MIIIFTTLSLSLVVELIDIIIIDNNRGECEREAGGDKK